jgi:hypothetical protein
LAKFDDFDVVEIVSQARNKMAQDRHAERKFGTVRGGSVGAIINNNVYGVCHRKAYLRYYGIETPLDGPIELMTTQGEKNEELWLEELAAGLPEGYVVKDQNEFPCVWDVGVKAFAFKKDGTLGKKKVDVTGSGSPDVTIWNKEDYPVLGLELKNISSFSKTKGAHYELRPNNDHLIQAATTVCGWGTCTGEGIHFHTS